MVFEPVYHNGRRARSQAARLTTRGIWHAIRLTRGYDPALAALVLAATDIKATLTRLEAERNPLALELAGYRHDAQAFRQQEAGREALERKTWETIEKVQEILARPRRKLSTRHYERLNKFLESRGIGRAAKVSTFEQPAFPPTPSAGKISAPTSKPAFTSKQITPPAPRTPQEKYLAALHQPPPPPTLEQMEARRLEAERRQRDCLICQTGVDPNFLMHDPATHLAYLGTK